MGLKFMMMLALAGCSKMPEPPPGVSLAFQCKYYGVVVLEGYLTVHESVAEQAEHFDLDRYWLECDTPDAKGLKCQTLE